MSDRQLPKWSELRPLLRAKPFVLDPVERRLADAFSIGDLRRLARRRTPRSVFDYTDGAAEEEISLRRARQLFRRLEFQPAVLRDVSGVDTSLLGHSYYGSSDSVLTDMAQLLHEVKPPDLRDRLKAVPKGTLRYWQFLVEKMGLSSETK